MTRIAIFVLAGLVLAAAPAAAQNQGQTGAPSSPMGSSMPQGAPGDTPASGNMGQLEHMSETEKFAFERSGSDKAVKFAAKAQAFITGSADERERAMSVGRDAQAGKPFDMSGDDIRAALEADLQDWRKTFSIPKAQFQSIHEQLVPAKVELTAAEWAVRRAQWFQARDKWIDDQRALLGIPAGG
ncbi:hypothetical protein GRI89_16095 [Altererythrobacter salegens]|uniref:Uncharacterized protein n=1 Tax=Croceibacterium salegens TaxID=1737568 RepID=A0A6I4SYE4_9SPHN|nr:hypothetical protein [Croceibacterium salegens]MXO61065.1 hypothetical protein [Croceibacterium salegens]